MQIRLSRDLEGRAGVPPYPMTVEEFFARFPEVPRHLRLYAGPAQGAGRAARAVPVASDAHRAVLELEVGPLDQDETGTTSPRLTSKEATVQGSLGRPLPQVSPMPEGHRCGPASP